MDGRVNIPLTPSYARDPSDAAAAGVNPSPGSFGFASAHAPPITGPARGIFMAPRITSAGGIVSAPAVKTRAPLSKLPNAAVEKAGKVSAKNKSVDDSSRRLKKKLAQRVTDVVVTEAPASSLVAQAANASAGCSRALKV
ncbi:hypothetical protein D1007_60285 [Hordeum vulgare]|nr:hypothetical protein D1007_60285 [Hordeum vulgare]